MVISNITQRSAAGRKNMNEKPQDEITRPLDKIVSILLCFSLGHIVGECFYDGLNFHTKCQRCNVELIKKLEHHPWQSIKTFMGWQTYNRRVSCPKC